tara:strand:- start:3984 stop:4154 length:171 start_codon:yes stop_codon:yes gene_type:complete
MTLTKDNMINMYLDWFNNFLTVQAFADHYQLSTEKAEQVINQGRYEHEKRVFADLL